MEQIPEIEPDIMPDYDLNEFTAKLAGYHVDRVSHMFQDHEMGHDWVFTRPDGTSYRLEVSDDYVDREFCERVPQYLKDVDDAVFLLNNLEWKLSPGDDPNTFLCVIEWGPVGIFGHMFAVEKVAHEPLRALVLAWVAYKLRISKHKA